jgi:regulator of sigma E protease
MLTAIVAIIIFALLVSAHEFGHFITAKLSGMYVDEFSIGMGPLVFAKQIGETKYSLRLLPLGGFVRVLGEDVEEEERSGVEQIDVPSERRYQNRPVWQRIIFASAGSFMNMLSAIIIFALMFMIAGEAVPIANPGTTISAVVENGPAHTAGLLPGDTIVEVDGVAVDTWAELTAVIVQAPVEQPMQVIVERENTDGVM